MKSKITLKYSLIIIFIVFIVTIINFIGLFLILMQSNLLHAVIELVIAIPILDLIIAIYFGIKFSRKVTEPMKEVIQGVENLEDDKYDILNKEDGIYKDVKEKLNNLAQKLKQNEIERKKIELMRNEWISNITHDIKTPLSSIKGYGELLESYSDFTEEEIKQSGFIINQKSDYIKELVDDLNLTVYLKDDKRRLNIERSNIVTEIKSSIISILNDSIYSERDITFESNKEVIEVNFDIKLFKRLIANLVYNSLIHNDDNVKIDVKVLQLEKIYIIVEDNGKGISENDLENIFDKYYRGTNTSSVHKGSGLGMAIVYNIVKAHGWNIGIESKLDVGTKIQIII